MEIFAKLMLNPFQNPATLPLVLTLTVIFAGAGLALAVFDFAGRTPTIGRLWFLDFRFWLINYARREFQPSQSAASLSIEATRNSQLITRNSVLWQRYRTWAIIAPLYAGAALCGPLSLALFCALLCWQGGREYAHLTGLPALHFRSLVVGGALILTATLLFGPNALLYAPVLAFFGWAVFLSPESRVVSPKLVNNTASGHNITSPSKTQDSGMWTLDAFRPMLLGFWGLLYLGWLPVHLVALGMGKMPGLVLVVGLGVALSDVGAFCTGKLIGGPKLAPRLSPNKTWGGVIGNLGGAALALGLLLFALPGLQLWQIVILVLVIGMGSLWGDLLESLLKRQSGVKDAGNILPGFGGLLDRIDSLLLVAPLVYYTSLLIF